MMKNILACLLSLGFSGTVLADDPASPAAPAPAQPQPPATAHAPPQPGGKYCVQETGSHVSPKPGECLPVPGRSYSREDLENTGSVSNSDALRRLDPSIH